MTAAVPRLGRASTTCRNGFATLRARVVTFLPGYWAGHDAGFSSGHREGHKDGFFAATKVAMDAIDTAEAAIESRR